MFLVVDNVGSIVHRFESDYPEAAVLAFLRLHPDPTLGHRLASDPAHVRRSVGGILLVEVQYD